MAEHPRRRRGRRAASATVATALAVAVLALAGCGSDAPDPEAERLERIEHRLGSSFSDAQADCIVDHLDDEELDALDRGRDLPADGAALTAWTEAVTDCITDGRPTSTTTSTPGTPTSEPTDPGATTTTTAGG